MWSSNKNDGVTLIELLVSLSIVVILATVAMPYGEIVVKRSKEIELRRSLREIRTAIDNFHFDWKAGNMAQTNEVASAYGYPLSLQVLTEEVVLGDGSLKRYLRRIPRNPLSKQTVGVSEQWLLRGYEDSLKNSLWNAKDVYDVKISSDQRALDGSWYRDW